MRACLLAVLLLALVLSATARAAPRPSLEEIPCPEDAITLFTPKDIERKCLWLHTREHAEGGAQLSLGVIVLTPRTKGAPTPPTVFVHGGPGYGFLDAWWALASAEFARRGQVIMFDQRGVGWSSPKLCPSLDEDRPELDRLTTEKLRDYFQAQVPKCLAELAGAADVAAYGTHPTVRDMETLRTLLGIDKWNVYGVSYGTTVTLAYMAAHPERTRAAVIDSVYPPEMASFTSVVPDLVASLEHLDRLCAANPACKRDLGALEPALSATIAALDAAPLPLDIVNPLDMRKQQRHLSGTSLLAMVQLHMLSTSSWYLVPRLIADAKARRKSWLLQNRFSDLIAFQTSGSLAVWLATECRERAPFEDRAEIAAQVQRWPVLTRSAFVDTWLEICATWPVKDAAPGTTPRDTSVPTLVVAGAWDSVTPPAQSERTARALGPRAQFVLVPNAAHGPSMPSPCMEDVVARFLAAPDAKVEANCTFDPPMLTAEIIPFDATVAYELLSPTPVSILPSAIVVFGIGAALVWPFAWLRGAPLASSLWFLGAVAILIAWLAWLSLNMRNAGSEALTWLSYGIPAETVPGHSLIWLMPLAAIGGLCAWAAESMHGKITAGRFLHRALVSLGLVGAFVTLDAAGLIPHAPQEISADLRRLLALILPR
jgi:pimeloyl-ACP methyl ester carboxylesterase